MTAPAIANEAAGTKPQETVVWYSSGATWWSCRADGHMTFRSNDPAAGKYPAIAASPIIGGRPQPHSFTNHRYDLRIGLCCLPPGTTARLRIGDVEFSTRELPAGYGTLGIEHTCSLYPQDVQIGLVFPQSE
jgi:hypothetical protein